MMVARTIAGKNVEFDAEGYLLNPDDWTKDMAVELAKEEGIDPLSEAHWQVIEFVRADTKAKGESPTIRRITKEANVSTKDIYTLFPKGPGKKVARIAGVSKPKGCI
jgi:dissimilatory sulfite reductase related protein